jgi:hypothetical protein
MSVRSSERHPVPQDEGVQKTAIVLVLAALLSGCGGGDSTDGAKSGSSGQNGAPGATVTLSPQAAMAQAMADVNQVAPKLQAYFAAHGYPTDLAGVAKSMTEAGLYMDPSDALASYKFDPKTKQWTMCVQNDNGAWASFDTGSIGGHGTSGGCPQS